MYFPHLTHLVCIRHCKPGINSEAEKYSTFACIRRYLITLPYLVRFSAMNT